MVAGGEVINNRKCCCRLQSLEVPNLQKLLLCLQRGQVVRAKCGILCSHSEADTQSLFIRLRHLRKSLVLANSQLGPTAVAQKLRGLNSLCAISKLHDSPFLLGLSSPFLLELSCVFCWRPKWPHLTLPTPIRVTLKQLSRGTTDQHHHLKILKRKKKFNIFLEL